MAILNDTIINGDIRGRSPVFNVTQQPPSNFNMMYGTKIISDSVGASTGSTGGYSYGNLFLGSVCTSSIASNSEVTESDLQYVSGVSIASSPGGFTIFPCNYNYKTGAEYSKATFNSTLGSSSYCWSGIYVRSITAPKSALNTTSSTDYNYFSLSVDHDTYSGSSTTTNLGSGVVYTFNVERKTSSTTTVSTSYKLNIEANYTNGLSIYPTIPTNQPSSASSCTLGSYARPFTQLFLGNYSTSGSRQYTGSIGLNGNGIYVNVNASMGFNPILNSTSTGTGISLGMSTYKWRYLYAYSGTIQTSDRSSKDSIHYLDSSDEPKVAKMLTMSTKSSSTSTITMDDVIDFVKNIKPTTFCYYDGSETATEDNSDPEMIQLGLIADDIKDHKLYKYIGVDRTDEVTTEEEKDEEGNVVKELETQSVHTLGLQVLPLTVAALTACKYLLNQVETLKTEIEELKK